VRRLLVLALLVGALLTCTAAASAPAPSTATSSAPAPAPGSEPGPHPGPRLGGSNPNRHPERFYPGPYDILFHHKQRFIGTDRRSIVIEPRFITLYHNDELVWSDAFDGAAATLQDVAAVVARSPRPTWLQRSDPGVLTLRATITQAPGTALVVAAPAVRQLRMSSETVTFISGDHATARFTGVAVSSWDPRTGGPVTDSTTLRPFLTYQASTLVIDHCDMGYLGSDRFSAYGVNWDAGSTGSATASTFHHNFFGAYMARAHDVRFVGNVFRDNVVYGLDPHTFTTRLFAEHNEAFRNGSHGIVFSDGVTDSVIRANHVHDNGVNGIVLDRQSDRNVVEGNDVAGNGRDGIVVISSSGATISGNNISGGRVGIRVNGDSVGNTVQHNMVSGPATGIEVYDGARQTVLGHNVVTHAGSTGIVAAAAGTVSTGDLVTQSPTGVRVEGVLTLDGTQITSVDRGVVVRPTGIVHARGITVHAHRGAVSVEPSGVARVHGSSLQATKPVKGRLRESTGNDLRALPLPAALGAESPPVLALAGASFLLLAVLLQAVHRVRNGVDRAEPPGLVGGPRFSVSRRGRTALRWTAAVAALPVALVLLPSGTASGQVRAGSPGQLVLSAGDLDLPQLDDVLKDAGYPDALSRSADGAWLLRRTLTVGPGAELKVNNTTLRLASTRGVLTGLQADGGRVSVQGSTVTSWDTTRAGPDEDLTDGRAWLLATGGGALDVADARLIALGYDAPTRTGVSWRGAGVQRVDSTRVSGNFRGLDVSGVQRLTIHDVTVEGSLREGLVGHGSCAGLQVDASSFSGSGAAGVALTQGCAGAVVRSSTVDGNAGVGVQLDGGADRVLLDGNDVYGNAGTGVDVAHSAGALLTKNLVYANPVGVWVRDGSTGGRIEGNRLAGNFTDGLRISNGANGATVGGNRIDFNYRAGVYAENVAPSGAGNDLAGNAVGAWLGPGAVVQLGGNVVEGNSVDGVRVSSRSTVTLAGNTVRDNATAFAVPVTGASAPYLARNRVQPGKYVLERIQAG
jgi:parallel beta-helix repeat protein